MQGEGQGHDRIHVRVGDRVEAHEDGDEFIMPAPAAATIRR